MIAVDAEAEKKEILKRYRALLRASKHSREKGDKQLIRRAFEMSVDAHKEMRRKSGEPYVYHPIAVAMICAQDMGLGTTSIVCALLHDVVEDTDIELVDIERHFGKKVASIIDGLTKISGVFDKKTDSIQAENFRKMLLTLSDDVRVILIKLADRLHNMRTLGSMARSKQLKIASETLYLYAPLAHRLGLYGIKTELEDLSVKYTEAELFKEITLKIKATKARRTRYINKFIAPIKTELEKQDMKFEIKGRLKSVYSIMNKMKRQQIPFEEVYDLFAIRIIIDSPYEVEKSDCWKVYSMVTDNYYPNPDRLRDWVSTPKTNGYESLHTTVMGPNGRWVEVQIRTKRMDEIAEKGYAAHWKYKDGSGNVEGGLDDWLSRVRDILENPDSNAIDFLDDFKLNLFAEEIYVFTPKGELRKLPNGGTALDFAFEIHTQVGSKCIGAKVNNKLVPLSTVLANGDQVEIITSTKQKVHEDWLQFVVTAKARTKIKSLLKEEKKKVAEDGKETLKRKFRNAKIPYTLKQVNQLVTFFDVRSSLDLFYALAIGKIDKDKLNLKSIFEQLEKQKKGHKAGTKPEKLAKKAKVLTSNDVVLDGEPGLDYHFAACCNPIPGDDIFGFVTVGEGVKIHRTNCPNAVKLMSNYGYRVLKADWASDLHKEDKAFLARIKLNGIDSVGIISNITDIISKQLEVNMKSITVESNEGTFEGTIDLFIHDTSHLDELMTKIKSSTGLMNVYRIDVN